MSADWWESGRRIVGMCKWHVEQTARNGFKLFVTDVGRSDWQFTARFIEADREARRRSDLHRGFGACI